MNYKVTVLPERQEIAAEQGTNLLELLRSIGRTPETPCGGKGICGKCRVTVNGKEMLACKTVISENMIVRLQETAETQILTDGIETEVRMVPYKTGYPAAFDIGTTTVAGFLLDKENGKELAHTSSLNPQKKYGADVVSRIQSALAGTQEEQSRLIRNTLEMQIDELCKKAGICPEEISVISIVGNPCMQQLLMNISLRNLAGIPFEPVLKNTELVKASGYIPACKNADLLVIPDISGYVGADTLACILATEMDKKEEITLMVDIGTNGEMVLGNREKMIACSTAAGPALEGADITFGMRGAAGAIDHVWLENEEIHVSVIGNGKAIGICGSGLIDAVAVMKEKGVINKRGRITAEGFSEDSMVRIREINEERVFYLTPEVYITQRDVRQVQLAKGAIAAGIELMAKQYGIAVDDIQMVMLAGAFGSFLNPENACRIGLLPEELSDRIVSVGNAAGSGARMLACSRKELEHVQKLRDITAFLELASLKDFQSTFGKRMGL